MIGLHFIYCSLNSCMQNRGKLTRVHSFISFPFFRLLNRTKAEWVIRQCEKYSCVKNLALTAPSTRSLDDSTDHITFAHIFSLFSFRLLLPAPNHDGGSSRVRKSCVTLRKRLQLFVFLEVLRKLFLHQKQVDRRKGARKRGRVSSVGERREKFITVLSIPKGPFFRRKVSLRS